MNIPHKLIKNIRNLKLSYYILNFRFVAISIILLFLLIKNIESISSYKAIGINAFYLGGKISSSIGMMLLGKKPVIDIFILHGYFIEILESVIAFRIFGISIGSFLLFDTLLSIFSYMLFLLLISRLIKNNHIFLLCSLFFLGTQIKFRIINNVVFFIYLLISIEILRRKESHALFYLLQSFLVFANFYYAIEVAYYTLATHIFFILNHLFIILKSKFLRNKKYNTIVRIAKGYIVGFFLSTAFGFFLLGNGLKQYLIDIIFTIPRLSYAIFKPEFPLLSSTSFYPYYLPILILLINLAIIIYFFIKRRIKGLTICVFVFIISVIHFQGILSRSNINFIGYDKMNINYNMWPLFLSTFFILNLLLIKENRLRNKLLLYSISALLFLSPFFSFRYLFLEKGISSADIKMFINLPQYKDSFWVNSEQNKVTNFIKSNTSKNDYIYVFNNEVLYYYLFKRKNPTNFYISSLSEPSQFQEESVNGLRIKKPKYVVYNSDNYWSNNADNIPQDIRLSKINEWLLQNYKNSLKIDSTVILY